MMIHVIADDTPAKMVEALDDFFATEALSNGDCRSSFTANDRSVTATALARLSKTVSGLVSDFGNLVNGLLDEV